jgi:hypothetical protein
MAHQKEEMSPSLAKRKVNRFNVENILAIREMREIRIN